MYTNVSIYVDYSQHVPIIFVMMQGVKLDKNITILTLIRCSW